MLNMWGIWTVMQKLTLMGGGNIFWRELQYNCTCHIPVMRLRMWVSTITDTTELDKSVMKREWIWLNMVTDTSKYEMKYIYGTDTKCEYMFDN